MIWMCWNKVENGKPITVTYKVIFKKIIKENASIVDNGMIIKENASLVDNGM